MFFLATLKFTALGGEGLVAVGDALVGEGARGFAVVEGPGVRPSMGVGDSVWSMAQMAQMAPGPCQVTAWTRACVPNQNAPRSDDQMRALWLETHRAGEPNASAPRQRANAHADPEPVVRPLVMRTSLGRGRGRAASAAMLPTLTAADVDRLLAAPGPAWIFKHSNACPISSAAHDEVAQWCARHPGAAGGMVVVQVDRPLSTLIAQRLGRVHQSPQLFLLRSGTVAWSASHWSITAAAMDAAWEQA